MAVVQNVVPDMEEEEATAPRIQPCAQSVLGKLQISHACCCLPDAAETLEGEHFKLVAMSAAKLPNV